MEKLPFAELMQVLENPVVKDYALSLKVYVEKRFNANGEIILRKRPTCNHIYKPIARILGMRDNIDVSKISSCSDQVTWVYECVNCKNRFETANDKFNNHGGLIEWQ